MAGVWGSGDRGGSTEGKTDSEWSSSTVRDRVGTSLIVSAHL